MYACCICGMDMLLLSTAGQHDDVRFGSKVGKTNPLAQFNAVHAGHLPVNNTDVNAACLEKSAGLLPIVGADGFMPPVGHGGLHQPARDCVVFRNEYLELFHIPASTKTYRQVR